MEKRGANNLVMTQILGDDVIIFVTVKQGYFKLGCSDKENSAAFFCTAVSIVRF